MRNVRRSRSGEGTCQVPVVRPASARVALSIYLSIYPSIFLSVCLSFCLSICIYLSIARSSTGPYASLNASRPPHTTNTLTLVSPPPFHLRPKPSLSSPLTPPLRLCPLVMRRVRRSRSGEVIFEVPVVRGQLRASEVQHSVSQTQQTASEVQHGYQKRNRELQKCNIGYQKCNRQLQKCNMGIRNAT